VRAEENENHPVVLQANDRTHLQSEPGFPHGVRIQFLSPNSEWRAGSARSARRPTKICRDGKLVPRARGTLAKRNLGGRCSTLPPELRLEAGLLPIPFHETLKFIVRQLRSQRQIAIVDTPQRRRRP